MGVFFLGGGVCVLCALVYIAVLSLFFFSLLFSSPLLRPPLSYCAYPSHTHCQHRIVNQLHFLLAPTLSIKTSIHCHRNDTTCPRYHPSFGRANLFTPHITAAWLFRALRLRWLIHSRCLPLQYLLPSLLPLFPLQQGYQQPGRQYLELTPHPHLSPQQPMSPAVKAKA